MARSTRGKATPVTKQVLDAGRRCLSSLWCGVRRAACGVRRAATEIEIQVLPKNFPLRFPDRIGNLSHGKKLPRFQQVIWRARRFELPTTWFAVLQNTNILTSAQMRYRAQIPSEMTM